MTDQNEKENWSMDNALRYIYINEVIFVSLILLCFIGELLADLTDRVALFYWFCVTPIFFCCSIISEKARAVSTGVKNTNLMRYELLYWGSAMTAVLLVFLLWHVEAIKPSGASMSIHIILAHTMFLSGVVLGFHYYLVGIFLFVTAFLSIVMGGTFSLDLVLLLPIIYLGFFMEKHYLFPTLKRTHDFTKEIKSKEE